MSRIDLSLVGLMCVPILTFLAWNGWVRRLRKDLPSWRNGMCLSALLLLSLHWIAVAILEVPIFLIATPQRSLDFTDAMLTLSHPLSVAIVVLAVALRRAPRVEAFFAGLLMLFCWPIGYV